MRGAYSICTILLQYFCFAFLVWRAAVHQIANCILVYNDEKKGDYLMRRAVKLGGGGWEVGGAVTGWGGWGVSLV